MSKISLWSAILGVSGLLGVSTALADSCADTSAGGLTVTQYGVTVLDVSLCQDSSCNSSSKVVTGSINDLNLAGSAGVKGTMAPAEIPFGTYGWIRVVIEPTINVAGFATVGKNPGSECITKTASATGIYTPGATWVDVVPPVTRTPGTVALTIPDPTSGLTFDGSGNIEFIRAVGPIVVKEGSTFPAVDLKFTAKEAIGIGGIDAGLKNRCVVGVGTPHIELTIGSGPAAIISNASTVRACTMMKAPLMANW